MASSLKVMEKPMKQSSSYNLLPPEMSELNIVLLGRSWSDRRSVMNLLLGETEFDTEEEPDCILRVSRQLTETRVILTVTLTVTPDLLHPNISEDELREHIEQCVSPSDPGPHAFLLVLQPEDFTDERKLRLCKVLRLFGDQSFNRSLVLISTPREEGSGSQAKDVPDQPLRDMMSMCRYRYLKLKNLELPELLTRLGQIVKENHGEHVSCDLLEKLKGEDAGLIMSIKSEKITPVLSLVLSGRRGAGKTLAAKAVLGGLHSESNPSKCVKNQGEVCGRQVSVVELPALYGKPQEEVMEESLRCMSLCDPDGVHAFILVLPPDTITEADKKELEIIQNIFGSRVKDFTMIVFTVESDPDSLTVDNFLKENKDIQELRESCGRRHAVLNTQDRQKIPQFLDAVEKMSGARSFTKDMFTKAQMERVIENISTEESMASNVEKILRRKEEDLKRKHEEDLKKLKMNLKEQEGEIEQERKLRAKQLKEKEECVKKEREERKKEREEGERKRKKQEETHRQEVKRRQEASERIIQSEREQREDAVRKLESERKEMRRCREAWDKERKDMWEQKRQEDKQSLEELKTSFTKLQQEYHSKRRKWTYFLFVLSLSLLFSVCYILLR